MFWNKHTPTNPTISQDGSALVDALKALAQPDTDGAQEEKIQALLSEYPMSLTVHLCASALYARQGRMAECFAEHAVSLALEPTNPVPFRRLGLLLRRSGQEALAQKILENGWSLMEPLLPKQQHAQEKQRFFSQEGLTEGG